MAGRLAGKVAVVVGAASCAPGDGIGRAIALLFAREGASTVVVNRTLEHCSALADEIVAGGGDALAIAADATVELRMRAMVEETVARFGRLDVLVCNVGSGGPGTVVDTSEQLWDATLRSNLGSVLLGSKFAVPAMVAGGGGSIVCVSSIAAVRGFSRAGSGFAAYSAAKAGVIGLTRSIAADFAGDGVRANCLLVGMANTPRMEKFGEEHREKRRLAVPLRTEGTAWDAAFAALFLASDESRWITGVCLPVDGGQTSLSSWPA